MIATIAQTEFRRAQRSWNLASVTASITRAAEHHPAPDLIALPNCCAAALVTSDADLPTPTMCQTFAETLAWQAREWGVWIAAGHARSADGRIVPGATLFDPDGDAYLRYPQPVPVGDRNETKAADEWAVRRTPLGVVALRCGRAPTGRLAIHAPEGLPLDLAIVPIAPDEAARGTRQLIDLARSASCYVCVIGCVAPFQAEGGDSPARSVIIDRKGNIVAQTWGEAPQLAVAELDITPPATTPPGNMEDVEDLE